MLVNNNVFEQKDWVVVNQLMKQNNKSRREAIRIWYTSKTREYVRSNKLGFVSGMRCYWELTLELSNDPRWLNSSWK